MATHRDESFKVTMATQGFAVQGYYGDTYKVVVRCCYGDKEKLSVKEVTIGTQRA